MASSPRHYAEKLLEEFRRLAREERSPASFLDLAEAIIHEAVAYELDWLAEYLTERAKRMAPQRGETVKPAPAPRLVRGKQLPPDISSGQLPQ